MTDDAVHGRFRFVRQDGVFLIYRDPETGEELIAIAELPMKPSPARSVKLTAVFGADRPITQQLAILLSLFPKLSGMSRKELMASARDSGILELGEYHSLDAERLREEAHRQGLVIRMEVLIKED